MKKLVVALIFVACLASASGVVAYYGFFGPGDTPKGCICCIKNTCFVAKSEADCVKVGGAVVKNCEECEKESPK